MSKVIIGKCDMCGIDMIVGTPIEDKVVCHNCYVKYEKDKISFLQELTNKQKQQISDLQSQLTEKDKEIEMLKHTLNLYNLRHKGSVLPNVNQLAIQELEKVKDYICYCTYIKEPDYTNVRRKIDNRIKELKGETK